MVIQQFHIKFGAMIRFDIPNMHQFATTNFRLTLIKG
jgi:hypothetical protein